MSEVATLAANLARNCGYAVFPVREDKRPPLKDWPKLASKDAAAIADLWRRYPCPLVGIVTGAASGISVLDIDRKHDAACMFWQRNRDRLLPTRAFITRSGGLHLYYRHHDGIRNTQSRVCPGVDTRGEGGFIISWWCAGLDCYDLSPPAAWPEWLGLTTPAAPPPTIGRNRAPEHSGHAVTALIQRVASAPEGERNAVLYWAACKCREKDALNRATETSLLVAARAAGLSDIEARRTIQSARRQHERQR